MSLDHVQQACSQAWPAFALVAGLLLVGAVAAREGLFAGVGAFAARAPGGATALLASLLLVEAAVTAVLNLDTAVVFFTPVLLHAARRRGIPDEPFLYGAVFMANSASLLLPGSNLTNLIVVAHDHVSGTTFAARLWPAWVVAVAVTIGLLALVFRRVLRAPGHPIGDHPPFRPRAGTFGAAVAAVLVLVVAEPALPVLTLGIVVALVSRLPRPDALATVNPPLLLGVLAVAIALGTLARSVSSVGPLVAHAGRWQSAGLGVGGAVLLNNLPAAALLAAHVPAHPRALLLGLDLGPNLVVTGSLSTLFWLQVARSNGARPSVRRFSVLGAALVPLTLVLGLLAAVRF